MGDVFSLKRKVLKEEIDELNHVNNIVYLQWIQDVAYKHWNVLTAVSYTHLTLPTIYSV